MLLLLSSHGLAAVLLLLGPAVGLVVVVRLRRRGALATAGLLDRLRVTALPRDPSASQLHRIPSASQLSHPRPRRRRSSASPTCPPSSSRPPTCPPASSRSPPPAAPRARPSCPSCEPFFCSSACSCLTVTIAPTPVQRTLPYTAVPSPSPATSLRAPAARSSSCGARRGRRHCGAVPKVVLRYDRKIRLF